MIAHHRSTFISALLGAGIVLLYLWARAAFAAADDPPPVLVDAGAIDRAALIAPAVDAGPAVAAPSVEPATVDEGLDLAGWLWIQYKAGRIALALIVGLQALGIFALKRWAWVSRLFPRLKRGKALAATSSLVGSLAGVAPLALAGASPWAGLVIAVGTACGVYLLPGPVEVAGETVPA